MWCSHWSDLFFGLVLSFNLSCANRRGLKEPGVFQHRSESVHSSSGAVVRCRGLSEWKSHPGLFYMQFLFARKLVLHDQHICIKDNQRSSEPRQALSRSELWYRHLRWRYRDGGILSQHKAIESIKKQQCLQGLLYFLINANLTGRKKCIVFRAHSSQGFPGIRSSISCPLGTECKD